MAATILKVAAQVIVGFFVNKYELMQQNDARAVLRRLRARQKIQVSYQGGTEPRRKLYGIFRCGGLDCMPAVVTGPTGSRLHRLLAISDGELHSIDAVYFNNDCIFAADFAGGPITAGPYIGYAQIFTKLGTASQSAVSAATVVPGWDVDHRGDGVAYVYCFFDYAPEIWKAGAPNVIIEGKGVKCYDPRLDITPGLDPTNPVCITYTTNPALILVDFLLWSAGGNEDAANIIWADVVTAANLCDENVDIPNSATQKRYTCSTEVYAPQTLQERDKTIMLLARAMMGACWFAGGKWHMRAGAHTASVGTITDSEILGDDYEIDTAKSRASGASFNTLRGIYTEPTELNQQKDMPEVSVPAYVTEDDEKIHGDIEFTTARSVYEIERNAIILIRQTRNRIVISQLFKFRCWKFQLYDTVTCTFSKLGWVNQLARVTRMKLQQGFVVEMELTEIDATDYDDPDPSDYETPNSVSPPLNSEFVPNAPRNLTASGQVNAIIFTWDPPINPPVGVLYQLYEYSSSTPFSSAVARGPRTAQNSMVVTRTNTTVAYFWVVAIDPANGATSANAPPTNGVPAAAGSATAGLSAVVVPGTATSSTASASQTTNTVTVTASGGTAPYTYATTWLSGGTGITTNNGTTASPSFSATGLSDGETRSGTAKITVTDNVSATYDVLVAVTITRGATVTVNNSNISQTGGSMTAAVCNCTVAPDGTIQFSDGTSYTWLSSGSASDYEVKFTNNSGAYVSGTFGTWLPLSTGYAVVGARTPGEGTGFSVQNFTIEIRDIATHLITDSGTVNMTEIIP